MNEWKKAVATLARKSDETVMTIEERKRGRPSMLLEDITSHLKATPIGIPVSGPALSGYNVKLSSLFCLLLH